MKYLSLLFITILGISCSSQAQIQANENVIAGVQEEVSTVESSEEETEELVWLTNLEEALEIAKAEDKLVLMTFSGSDWCSKCIQLKKDLFQNEAFINFSSSKYVLVNIDNPMKKANRLPAEQQEYNNKLFERYNKKGSFPYTVIIDANGHMVAAMDYPLQTVDAYIEHLNSF